MATGSAASVATTATFKLRPIAVQSSGEIAHLPHVGSHHDPGLGRRRGESPVFLDVLGGCFQQEIWNNKPRAVFQGGYNGALRFKAGTTSTLTNAAQIKIKAMISRQPTGSLSIIALE